MGFQHFLSPTVLLPFRSLSTCPFYNILHPSSSITFKTLQNNQPSCLCNLLIPYCPPHSLRSSDQHLLTVPFFKSSQARRSFLFAAPITWNSLPFTLHTSSSIALFHSAGT